MNKKRFSFISILCVISILIVLLLLDSKLVVGLLNSVTTEKISPVPIEATVSGEGIVEEDADEIAVTPTASENPFIIVIDPGHQEKANLEQEPIGPGALEMKYKVTGGTVGVVTKKPEYLLVLEAAKQLKENLEHRGITVILTRTVNDVNISNSERAAVANEHEADLFVRLHADGSESPYVNGFSVLIPGGDNPYTSAVFDNSKNAAISVLESVATEMSLHGSGISYRNDMSGFNWSKVPVILTELGFMTNPDEDRNLSDTDYLTSLINLIAEGIEEYLNGMNAPTGS